MTVSENRIGELRRLMLELRSDLAAMKELSAFAAEIFDQGGSVVQPDRRDQMALALTIHHLYTAFEQALLRIARTFDRTSYTGGDWHRDLLRVMAVEVPGIRPPVLHASLLRILDEYRGFRHIVRHGYDYELDWQRMKPLVLRIQSLVAESAQALQRFITFTETCSASLTQSDP